MRIRFVVLTTIFLYFCVACTTHKGGVQTAIPGVTQSQTGGTGSGGTPASGTGDPGGGDGLGNKTFESYITDVTKLDEYKTYVKPISDYLEKATDNTMPGIDCNGSTMLDQIAKSKTWYIAPVSLEVLEKEKVGVAFFEDPIQQLAIQTDTEIWIDSKTWEHMSSKERATLLMHETVEAMYLLRFKTEVEIAAVYLKSCRLPDDNETLKKEKQEAEQTIQSGDNGDKDPKDAPEKKRSLVGDDYTMIRSATDFLMNDSQEIKSRDDFNMFLVLHKFDHRLSQW